MGLGLGLGVWEVRFCRRDEGVLDLDVDVLGVGWGVVRVVCAEGPVVGRRFVVQGLRDEFGDPGVGLF